MSHKIYEELGSTFQDEDSGDWYAAPNDIDFDVVGPFETESEAFESLKRIAKAEKKELVDFENFLGFLKEDTEGC